MKLSLNVLILLSLALCANALVYYTKMDKGANGCKPKPAAGKLDKPSTRDDTATPDPGAAGGGGGGGEIKVGEFAKDENTCGVNVCQNTEGDAIVLYCQKPAPFEMCNTDGVSTKAPFPECCWKCVAYTNCEETGGTTGNGETTAAPGDAATDAPALRTMPKKGTKNRKAIDFKKY